MDLKCKLDLIIKGNKCTVLYTVPKEPSFSNLYMGNNPKLVILANSENEWDKNKVNEFIKITSHYGCRDMGDFKYYTCTDIEIIDKAECAREWHLDEIDKQFCISCKLELK